MGNFWSNNTKRARDTFDFDEALSMLAIGESVPDWVLEHFDLSSQSRRRTEQGTETHSVYKHRELNDDKSDCVTAIYAVDGVITSGWWCEFDYHSDIPVTNEDVERLLSLPAGSSINDLPDTIISGCKNSMYVLTDDGWECQENNYAIDSDQLQTIIVDNCLMEVDQTLRNTECE